MMQSIFTKPLFINPLAYLVIPELTLINKCNEFIFNEENLYNFQIITNDKVSGKIIQNGADYILHLDLYTPEGNVILGEFNISGVGINPDLFLMNLSNGMITITFNNILS